jgi:hypothetical protein
MGRARELKVIGNLELLPDEYRLLEQLTAQYENGLYRYDITALHGTIRSIHPYGRPTRNNTLNMPPLYRLDRLELARSRLEQITLPTLPNLHTLILLGNNLGPESTKNLTLPHNLLYLNINENPLGPEGIRDLQLPPHLHSLGINYNQINPEGAQHLQLPPNLQELYISGNHLGPEGAKNLRLPPNLRYLNISENVLGPEGTQDLALPPSIKELHIRFNDLSPDDLQKLQEKYPTVKING